MKKLLSILPALIVLTIFSNNLFAQSTGKIAGKIFDQKSNETLIGASVLLQGTSKGAATNVDGHYVISGIAPGRYTLVVNYIGYQSKSISDIVVKANDVTSLNIALPEAETQALSEVVITATYRQASVASLYAQQKNSISISDGISAEVIKRSPDKNTSDVLKRVSGATIQDNKFVIVRGLGDRYNNALLDGTPLPSTEPNRKAFSFNIIPANLIENVVISKTGTPDIPGDFAGGTVQVSTKDIPEQDFITVGFGYGYNTQSTFKDFKSGFRSVSDFFAVEDQTRQLPGNFPTTSQVIGPPRLTERQNIQSINGLNNNYNIYNTQALPSQSYNLTIGRVTEIGKNKSRLGAILGLTYLNSQKQAPDIVRFYDDYNYRDNQYQFNTNLGVLLNLGYSFGSNKITFKNLYNRNLEDQFTYRTGSNLSNGSYDSRFYAFDLLEKSLLKSNIEGDHKVGSQNAKINWNLGYSNIINDQPDQKKTSYLQDDEGDPFLANITTAGKENTRLFAYLKENIYSAKVDYRMPVKLNGETSTLKVGASTQYRDRKSDARFLGLVLKDGLDFDVANSIRQRPIETLFGQNAINSGAYELSEIANFSDRYSANSFTHAVYAMFDHKLSEKVRIVYGVRVEKFDLELSTQEPDKKQPIVELNNIDPLPSVNFTYSLNDKTNLRASYYRTLARPEFRELAPLAYYNYPLLATEQGNSELQRSIIDNGDLRYEFYPSAGQILSVSVFYKHFQNAIEPFQQDQNSSPTITYFNAKEAYVYGFEMEARKSLEFINGGNFFKNTTAYANVAVTKSKITNPAENAPIEENRPLVGQSPYVINAGILHTELNNKLTFNLLYNRLGRRIFLAGGQRFASVYENPRDVLDFQIGYKVIKSKGEIKFNASDILNQKYAFYYDIDGNKKYTPAPNGTDQIYRSYKLGGDYSLSFTYTF